MTESTTVKTMRLRYAGTCAGCSRSLAPGETAHYLRRTKTVRCLNCGPGLELLPQVDASHPPPPPPQPPPPPPVPEGPSVELIQGGLLRAGICDDCGRRLSRGSDALFEPSGTAVLCLECVTLDTVNVVGIPGGGARRQHAKRMERHHTRVRVAHPRLGGLILALSDDPAHVRSWQTGAVGEEEFGRRLSGITSESLKVLHDRKLPRSSGNIDHLAVTSEAVWVLDAKRYKGKVETRGHGLFSRRPPDLFVGGRNRMKLVEDVNEQIEAVREALVGFRTEHGVADIPVRGALVFVDAEFGLFASPFELDGVWIGWGAAIRKQLLGQIQGVLSISDVAKRLARELRAG